MSSISLQRLHSAVVLASIGLLLAARPLRAQSAEPGAIDSLRTPASPAFTLLGIEPSAVERPKTPADFAFSVLNRAADLPQLPKNFAVEASPYWLVGQPTVTWQNDSTRSVGQSVARTFSVSMATNQPANSAGTDLGVGFRTSVYSGHLSQKTTDALKARAEALGQNSQMFLDLLDRSGGAALRKALSAGTITPAQHKEQLEALAVSVMASDDYKKLTKPLTDLAVSREGFMLDVAGGATWQFTGAQWITNQLHKTGVWVTPSYQLGPWDIVGVLRYLHDALDDDAAGVVEWGARPIYMTSLWTASIEYVRREVTDGKDDSSYRFAGVVERRVGADTWLTATFGRDRARDGKPAGLLAQFGVNLNFSHERFKF